MSNWKNRIVGHGEEAPDQLLANEANTRTHGGKQQNAMESILDEIGWIQDVIVNRRTSEEWEPGKRNVETVVDGHMRIMLALRRDEKSVPVKYVDLSPAEEAMALATFDPIGALAGVDREKLAGLLHDVHTTDATLQKFCAEMAEKSGLEWGEKETKDAEPQVDKAEELRKKWGVETGQLWELGEHRIVCGDCTDAGVAQRLMGKEKAVLFCTDPPYWVNYGELQEAECGHTKKWAKIENDNLGGDGTQAFLEKCFQTWLPFLTDNAAWYIWHAQKVQGYFTAAAAAAAQVLYHRQIVWVKPSLILGRGHFHWRHELCLYGWREGHPPPEPKDRSANTVWEFKRDAPQTYLHPTQKPLECFEWPMNYSTQIGDIVAEPFSGSGTQILAAENLGRKCRAVEISPGYVAVAIQRWADATGKEPKLVKS